MTEEPSAIDLAAAPCRPVRFGEVGVEIERRPDGVVIVSGKAPLRPYDANLMAAFWRHADATPDRLWLARREGPARAWTRLTYGEGRARVASVAAWLMDPGVSDDRPILVLSENSLNHAVLLFAGMVAGVPVCSVSVNYSLLSTDFERLRHVVELVTPGVIFAEQGAPFAAAIAAVALADAVILTAAPGIPGAVDWSEAIGFAAPDLSAHVAGLDPTKPARYMLTSGSTGRPKAVIHTMAMATGNTHSGFQAMSDAFAWDRQALDWLPWSHIAGSSLLTNLSCLGGALYIDDGRPLPGRFDETIRNLKEIPLRYYGTMPNGYAMLADALEADDDFARRFFGELRAMLFGGAGLPQALHDRLQRIAVRATGRRFVFVSGYGSTETGSAISYTWWEDTRVGIGLPVSGASFKLVPCDDVYEVRVKAPSVTPGYFADPDQTAGAFDEEGFLRMEDLVDFHDRDRPERGMIFAGRRAEQFKLLNGTFVSAGRLRESLLGRLAGVVREVVVCGDGEAEAAVLAWVDAEGVRRLTGGTDPDHPSVVSAVAEALAAHNRDNPGQSSRIARLKFLADAPDPEAHEISDKGSINRRMVLKRRATEVARLFAGDGIGAA
ncbi:MAG: AMP-binding protein [Alphaproteobacteria bacterium]|nr:AMP-binding protein [Alphaproteobacteria bacterium]MBU2378703.1 AMP-binding protein [Alphaproteobacteria bacterium]